MKEKFHLKSFCIGYKYTDQLLGYIIKLVNIINLSPNSDGKQKRVCTNCSNVLAPDENNDYGIYFCPCCGIRYNVKDTSPERQLKTYFAMNLDGSAMKVVQKSSPKSENEQSKSSTYLLEKELDRLHKKNIDAFDFLTGFIDNGMKITNIIINTNNKERDRNKSKNRLIGKK